MTINKLAGWGDLPVAGPASPGLGERVTAGLTSVVAAQAPFAKFDTAIDNGTAKLAAAIVKNSDSIVAAIAKLGPLPGPAQSTVPSRSAFLIVWSLNRVRDALCDQHAASSGSTNKQLLRHTNDARVKAFSKWLAVHYPNLAQGYDDQFCGLSSPDSDRMGFEIERRTRLAQLAGFEWEVMTTVMDSVNVPLTASATRVRGAKKS